MAEPVENKLPKGSFAIAHTEHSAYHLHTGVYHWSRYFVVRVLSADKDGRVKTFTDTFQTDCPKRVDSKTKIYSIPLAYAVEAEKLFAKQPLDFTGYADKEHLRLALVNQREIA